MTRSRARISIDPATLRGRWPWKRAYCPRCEQIKGRRPRTRDLAVNEGGRAKCFACELLADVEGMVDQGRARDPRVRQQQRRLRRDGWAPWIAKKQRELGPITDGGPVERYLRARGFEPPWPPTAELSEHPNLWHEESRRQWPAMVGVVRDQRGRIRGLHRTWLTPDGCKAPIAPNKKFAGRVEGGAIRLYTPIRWDSKRIALCEGIETALGLRQHVPDGFAVWACLSAGGLATVELPNSIEHVIIGPDHDRSGAGFRAMVGLLRRLREAAITAEVRIPPPGLDLADQEECRPGRHLP